MQPKRRRLLLSVVLGFSGVWLFPRTARADPIHDAAGAGNLAEVKRLLTEDPSRLEKRSADDRTALLYAVTMGRIDVTRFLLEKGANVNASNGVGDTPVFDAVYRGEPALLQLGRRTSMRGTMSARHRFTTRSSSTNRRWPRCFSVSTRR